MASGAAALGLPSAGRFDSTMNSAGFSLAGGAWQLSGYMPESAGAAVAQPDASVFTIVADASPVVRDATPALDGPGRTDAGAFTVVTDAQVPADLGGGTRDAGIFTVVADAKPSTPDVANPTPIKHTNSVLRICAYRGSGTLQCTEDGRSVCQATLQAQP